MTKKKGNGKWTPYEAYYFRANEQDPVVDWLRSEKEKAKVSDSTIHDHGGPAVSTLRAWWNGKVRQPRFSTVAASASAMGKTSIPIGRNKK